MKFENNEDLFSKINETETESVIEDNNNLTRDQFEKELIKKYHFKATKEKEDLYFYDSKRGVYVNDGDWLIKQECFNFNPEITTKQVDQIKQHIIWGNYVDKGQFNGNIEWLACKNVMVNLLTGEIRQHSPTFMATTQIPHNYPLYPFSMPSKIMKFFNQVMGPDDIDTVLDFIAYCLWRDFPYHRWLLLNGSGRNGKGVTTKIITRLLGKKNVSNETLPRILSNDFSTANLYGKMANIDADLSSKALSDTGMLKKLTGGDVIQGEFKYKSAFSFENYTKLIFAVNTMPETPDETDAFFVRPLIINFPNQFLGDNAIPNLIEQLATPDEMSALLGLVIRRVPRVLKYGISYAASHTIEENFDKYIRSSDPIRYFVETALRKDDATRANVSIDKMYGSYSNFCKHYKLTMESSQTFSRELKKHGFEKKQVRDGGKSAPKIWAWMYVKVIDWEKPEDDEQEVLVFD
jgi:putative DNA primase/helicase